MLVQLGQLSLYRCQSNQWFINRRVNDEDSHRTSAMKTTPSNSTGGKRERETAGTVSIVSRRGSQGIDRRTVRRANGVRGGWRASQSVRGLFGRWTLTHGPVVHMHRTLAQKKKNPEEGRRSERTDVVETTEVEIEEEQAGMMVRGERKRMTYRERKQERKRGIPMKQEGQRRKRGKAHPLPWMLYCFCIPCCSWNRDR